MIWLHGNDVTVAGDVFALGGLGALIDSSVALDDYGGDGSEGRTRVDGNIVVISGTVDPSPYSDASDPPCD